MASRHKKNNAINPDDRESEFQDMKRDFTSSLQSASAATQEGSIEQFNAFTNIDLIDPYSYWFQCNMAS